MKLIGCDRCKLVFEPHKEHTAVRLYDVTSGAPLLIEPTRQLELCPGCVNDFEAFMACRPAAPAVETEPAAPAPAPRRPTTEMAVDYANGKSRQPRPTGHRPWSEIPDHTCEICGRVGKQRFVKTETGWRCSPTSYKCPGNHPGGGGAPEAEPASTPDPDPSPPAPPAPAVVAPPPNGATARCQNCTRSFTLTGVVLRHAVEMHELKHSHIVDVYDDTATEIATA